MKKLGYKKSRVLSDILYTIAAAGLICRILCGEAGALSRAALIVFAAAVCLGTTVYALGCVCPKCGRIQPRGKNRQCPDCGTKLD